MLRKLLTTLVLVGFLSPLIGCQEKPETRNKVPKEVKSIVLSDVSALEPKSKKIKYQPLADYLATKLSKFGIGKGEVKIAPDTETLIQWISAGEVDLYFDSPYPASVVIEKSKAKPLLRAWKKGVAEYNSVFFARKDSGLTSLNDLKGKMIAFEVPDSSSGYMFPLVHLSKHGFNPVRKAEANHTVAADEVGYIFAGTDLNTVRWVTRGKVTAGVTDNGTFSEIPEATRSKLVVLGETDKFPRQVVVVQPNIDPKLLIAIKTVLMEMDENNKGREVLKNFNKTAQFDEFPGGAEATLAEMKESYKLIQKQ